MKIVRKKEIFAPFLLFLILLLSFQISVVKGEPGDSPTNAIVVILGDTSGSLPGPSSDGSIWYKITLTAGDYQFNLTGPGGTDFDLDLFDNALNIIGTAEDNTYPDILTVMDLLAGVYYINVYHYIGTGTFTLNIALYVPVPGDSPNAAIAITLGDTSGSLPGPSTDGSIWYVITLPVGDYQFSLTGPGGTDFDLEIYNSAMNIIDTAEDSTYPDLLAVMDLLAGDYYINIYPYIGTGTFTLNIAVYVPTPGDSPGTAITIVLGDTTGTLPGPATGDSIWYVITLPAGNYQFNLTGPGGTDFDLEIYNSAINIIGAASDITYPDTLTVMDIKAGDYYLNIQPFNGTGTFTLTIAAYIPAPGETPGTAIVIALGDTTGILPGPASYGSIWYKITLTAGDYQFNLIGPGGTNFNLQLYDSMMDWIGATEDTNYPDTLKVPNLITGEYYINVQTFNGIGTFNLNITTYIPAPGETPGTAIAIALGNTTGILPGPASGGSIWYIITLGAGNYQFNLTGPTGTDFNLELYDSMMGWIGAVDDNIYPDILRVPDLLVGDYYINVYQFNGTGIFNLSINTYVPAPGETPGTAIAIALGNTTGILPGPTAYGSIWYVISLPAGNYQFNLTGLTGTDFNMGLYNSTINYIGSADNSVYPDILRIPGLLAGDFYIHVRPYIGTGAFNLSIAIYIPVPGDSPGTAIIITLGDTNGTLPGPTAYGSIWYVITLPAGDYQFTLTGPGGTDFNLELYNNIMDPISETFTNAYPDILPVPGLLAGDYYIKVYPYSGEGNFTLNIAIYLPVPGDSPGTAIVIALGDISGTLPGPASDGSIWYAITVPAGNYQFTLTGPGGTDFNLELYDSKMGWIGKAEESVYPKILVVPGLLKREYYLNVQPFNGTGIFTLNIATYVPTPGETPGTAKVIALGDSTGSLPGPASDGSIWYVITLEAGDYQFTLTGPDGTDFNLALYDIEQNIGTAQNNIYPDILRISGLLTGLYYLNIKSNSGIGIFTTTITEYSSPTTTSPTTTSPTITSPTTISSTTISIIPIIFALILYIIIVIRWRRQK